MQKQGQDLRSSAYSQPILADEVQTFKALITIHKVLQEGHPIVLKEAQVRNEHVVGEDRETDLGRQMSNGSKALQEVHLEERECEVRKMIAMSACARH